MLPEPRTAEGRRGLAAILEDPGRALIGFDYDGTLSPIVDDPSRARPEAQVVDGLAELSKLVGMVAVVTGRPARVAVELAGFATASGLDHLVVVGHYGIERWDACSGELHTVPPEPGLATVRRELPGLLASLDLEDAEIEDKGLSVAVHVRGLDGADQAFEQLQRPLTELAEASSLVAEPGRLVVELRPQGMDKGVALRELVGEVRARAVMFAGDDLGDLAAFAEVRRLRTDGVAGLLVCSASREVTELAAEADLVVEGPAGVSALVAALVDALRGVRA